MAAEYDHLPVYKAAYDLLQHVYRDKCIASVPRDVKYTLVERLKQDILEVLVDLLMLLCFAVIIYYGFKVVNVTMMQKSPAMQLKMGYIYFSLVLGGGLMFLQGTIDLIKTIARIAGKEGACEQ